MKTVFLYIRVSTDEQANKGYSQRYQEEVLQKHCQLNQYLVLAVVKEDHSAKTFNRPEWKQIMSLLKKRQRPDLILFTKWDRFSRNTADAYQMIRLLNDLGIDPRAIEQPLDLSIPENKMMLAFYLSIPEVENDRRALNVFTGMRKAKKEGRWMGGAPIGYQNCITEQWRKYIKPIEPEATLVKWIFNEIAQGKYNTEQVWKEAKRKGLTCGKNNFRNMLRNPVYCGKITVSAYKTEPSTIVEGLHDAIIPESLFDQVQKALNNRRKTYKKQHVVPEQLVLRGFLNCPKCNRKLTGSPSTGRYARYFYYHCRTPCNYRQRADNINDCFLDELIALKPNVAWLPIFKSILWECYSNKMNYSISQRDQATGQMQILSKKFERTRDLLLNGDLEITEFRSISKEYDIKTEKLQEIIDAYSGDPEQFKLSLHDKGVALLRIYDFYKMADVIRKRKLLDQLFTSPFTFDQDRFINKSYSKVNLTFHRTD
jgi:site-specific DNA recombinase